jgi:hypothetical protein
MHTKALKMVVLVVAGLAGPSCGSSLSSIRDTTPCIESPAGVTAWWTGDTSSIDRVSNIQASKWGLVRYDSGKVLNGFLLDGTEGALTVPDGPTFDLRSSFSFMAWLKLRVPLARQPDFDGPSQDDYHFVLEKGDGSYDVRNYGLYFSKTTKTMHFNGIDTTGTQYVFNVTVANANTLFDDLAWHHVAAVWDQSSRNASIIIDGVVVGSASGSSNALMTNSFSLHVGAANSYRYFIDGMIDELMLFHRPLSSPEIQSMIAADTRGFCR